jgi:hypothetical protein
MNTASLPCTYHQPGIQLPHEKILDMLYSATESIELSGVDHDVRSHVIMVVTQDWFLLKKRFQDWRSRIDHASDKNPVVQILGSVEKAREEGYTCSNEHPELVALIWKEIIHLSRPV